MGGIVAIGGGGDCGSGIKVSVTVGGMTGEGEILGTIDVGRRVSLSVSGVPNSDSWDGCEDMQACAEATNKIMIDPNPTKLILPTLIPSPFRCPRGSSISRMASENS